MAKCQYVIQEMVTGNGPNFPNNFRLWRGARGRWWHLRKTMHLIGTFDTEDEARAVMMNIVAYPYVAAESRYDTRGRRYNNY